MLKHLSYTVQFPSTGRTFDNQIKFEPGLTAVTGRNEAGKSLIIEMIGYCLFGKSALRGAAADYKNLEAELNFTVNNKQVRVSRLPKKEELWIEDILSAVGAEAVNKAVPILLGFGLDVFNIALVAQQDELHALTKMKPTERGKMVEKLTGETTLAITEKDCKDSAKTHSQAAEAMAMMISQPIVPVKPEGYQPSEDIWTVLEAVRDRNIERNALSRITLPVEPVAPHDPGLNEEEIQEYQLNRDRLDQRKRALEKEVAAIPEPRYSLQDIEKAEEYDEYLKDVNSRGPRPNYSLNELREWEKIWLTPSSGECPNCGYNLSEHTFEAPKLAMAQVRIQLSYHARWEGAPTPRRREVSIDNPMKERMAHERHQERESLRRELSEITIPADRSDDLKLIRDYNQQRAVYVERSKRYAEDLDTFEKAQAALQALGEIESPESLHKAWQEACRYEEASVAYERDSKVYIEQVAKITEQRTQVDGFKRGADALKLTRQQVKQELTPSLSRESSKLLSVMTSGERTQIIVDEDFNVFVDGQPLATLSGSGKSVVNLALRIGLGRVLTSRILPIFIGDEVDYAMDKDRVGATQEMFRGLSSVLAQVILITHKDIEADNIVVC